MTISELILFPPSLDNGHYIFNIIQFSVFPQDGSSPELPSLERKNKRRKIKGKKGIVQNILADGNCSFSNSAFLQLHIVSFVVFKH